MLDDESVHLTCTSPPYWGLRDYKAPAVVWGPNDCEHVWGAAIPRAHEGGGNAGVPVEWQRPSREHHTGGSSGQFCSRCGAWRGQLGLEPTVDLYIQHLVEVFREVKRVLRNDGVLFLNLADSYASSSIQSGPSYGIYDKVPEGCPLRGCPWSRPCDGCQAAPVLRKFHNGHLPFGEQADDSPDPSPGHKEFEHGHLPTSRSLGQKPIPQSSGAIQGQGQSGGHVDAQPRASRASRPAVFSRPLPAWCSRSDNCVYDPSEIRSFADGVFPCEYKKADPSLRHLSSSATQGLQKNIPGTTETGDASARRTLDKPFLASCPYLHSTIPYRPSQPLKPKDLCMIPARVALALQADGWYLRSDIIWAKPNPMPESVTDRPTTSHEHVFLLTKSARYFYDADAVREQSIYPEDTRKPYAPGQVDYRGNGHDRGGGETQDRDGAGRNRRSVWTITTKGYPEAHFATFPPELPATCIKTSPTKVCKECGAGWERVVEKGELRDDPQRENRSVEAKQFNGEGYGEGGTLAKVRDVKTLGFRPTCDCEGETGRAVILDPFGGRGTTSQAALDLGRDFIHIDISYAELAQKTLGLYCPEIEYANAR